MELKGIEAPDDIGTYYICFSDNVAINSGSNALSGRDLVRDATNYLKLLLLKRLMQVSQILLILTIQLIK